MFCIKCGAAIPENSLENLCEHCYRKKHPEPWTDEKYVDGTFIKANYGFKKGITGLILSICAFVILLVTMVLSTIRLYISIIYFAATATQSSTPGINVLYLVMTIIVAVGVLVVLTLIINGLIQSINGLKQARLARRNRVRATKSFVIGIVSTAISSLITAISSVYCVIAIIALITPEIFKAIFL